VSEAYGVARPKEGDLDTGRSIDQHLHLLKPGARLEPRVPPNLAEAVSDYVDALLSARYPRHPRFTEKLTKKRVEHLVERFGEIVDAADEKIAADKALIEEMRGTLGALGLVRVTESAVHLVADRTLQELEQRRLQQAVDSPTVGQVRRWLDENDKMGLQDDALDLVVRCYARHEARTFMYFGKPYQPVAGTEMPDEVVLEKPDLPDAVAWSKALETAGHTLGLTMAGKALHADNLKRFEALLRTSLEASTRPVAELPGRLAEWAALVGVGHDADRLVTARSADELIAELVGQSAVAQVGTLAGFVARTSPRAVGKSRHGAPGVVSLLGDAIVKGVFEQLAARKHELAGAEELLENAAQALRQDELHVALAERLRGLAEAGQRLLAPPITSKGKHWVEGEPIAPLPAGRTIDRTAAGRSAAAVALDQAVAEARAELDKLGDRAAITVHIVVSEKPR